MTPSLHKLCQDLGYQFQDLDLLEVALTHRSASGDNNERLEFLGDSILSLVISNALYLRFIQADEGQLSRLRASLVKGDNLAKMARHFNFGDYLILGPGELKSGGYRRSSILADSFEAVLGAIYLDGGLEVVEALILHHFEAQLQALNPSKTGKDPKTRLQEWLQARRLSLPLYEVVATQGVAHKQVFKVRCKVEGVDETIYSSSNSRRKAEQLAAEQALELLQHG
ncbi:MAG: ribonuclease III [Gammaproteobacteria bacterium]|nr:ribonuclease III [Gammaproteobacteria bacterium]